MDRGIPNLGSLLGGRQPASQFFFRYLPGTVRDLKPVVVRGPITSGVARVVVDESRVVVVTQKETRGWLHDGAGLVPITGSTNKFRITIPSEPEPLIVVKAGGCTCGKPWIKKGTSGEVLATHAPVPA